MASWVTALVPSKSEPCVAQICPFQAAKKDDDPLTKLYRCKFPDCQNNRGRYAPASSEDATPVTIVNCYCSDRAREVCTIAQGTPTCIAKCKLQDVVRSRSRNRDGTTSYQDVLVALFTSLVYDHGRKGDGDLPLRRPPTRHRLECHSRVVSTAFP